MVNLSLDINSFKAESFREGYEDFLNNPERITELCQQKKKIIQKECEAKISSLTLEGQKLSFDEAVLKDSLNASGACRPKESLEAMKRQGVYEFLTTIIFLLVPSYFLTEWALRPFEMGWFSPFAAMGICIIVVISFERVLSLLTGLLPEKASLIWKLFIATAAGVFGSVAVVYISNIRGDLAFLKMAEQLDSQQFFQMVSKFYEKSIAALKPVFPLISLGLDFTAAVILHSGLSKLSFSKPILDSHKRLEKTRKGLIGIAAGIKRLEALPEIFEPAYMGGALKAEGEIKKKQSKKEPKPEKPSASPEDRWAWKLTLALIAFIIGLVLLIYIAKAFGMETVVIGYDVSLSSSVTDSRGVSEFHKNQDGVRTAIQNGRCGSEFKIYALHEESFSKPLCLLEGSIRKEPGFFSQFRQADLNSLLRKWDSVAKSLKPYAKETDIFGFLFLAQDIFESRRAGPKILILFSDMRHTRGVNLERPEVISPKMIERAKSVYGLPNLEGVKVYAYGVHGQGKSIAYMNSLKGFWTEYLKQSKGELAVFSPLREVRY